MQELNTLTANIQRQWLARILDGSKKIEYRDATDYWLSRLERVGPPPFRLRLINGMRPDSPEATLLVDRVDIDVLTGQIRLHIQEILEVIRWNPAWHLQYLPLQPEPSLDPVSLFKELLAESNIRLTVPSSVLESLLPGMPITFALPLTDDTYERFAEAPEGIFTVWLETDNRVRQVALLRAYDRIFEDVVDYTVVASPGMRLTRVGAPRSPETVRQV